MRAALLSRQYHSAGAAQHGPGSSVRSPAACALCACVHAQTPQMLPAARARAARPGRARTPLPMTGHALNSLPPCPNAIPISGTASALRDTSTRALQAPCPRSGNPPRPGCAPRALSSHGRARAPSGAGQAAGVGTGICEGSRTQWHAVDRQPPTGKGARPPRCRASFKRRGGANARSAKPV
ncbi:MAG: hypothetical protein J3K34DRAFT_414041 [Monoraphidium minutum]|nr:MAG: hypothetical protein J3K34DRAFT_414041 [Monoraphidium minutum]